MQVIITTMARITDFSQKNKPSPQKNPLDELGPGQINPLQDTRLMPKKLEKQLLAANEAVLDGNPELALNYYIQADLDTHPNPKYKIQYRLRAANLAVTLARDVAESDKKVKRYRMQADEAEYNLSKRFMVKNGRLNTILISPLTQETSLTPTNRPEDVREYTKMTAEIETLREKEREYARRVCEPYLRQARKFTEQIKKDPNASNLDRGLAINYEARALSIEGNDRQAFQHLTGINLVGETLLEPGAGVPESTAGHPEIQRTFAYLSNKLGLNQQRSIVDYAASAQQQVIVAYLKDYYDRKGDDDQARMIRASSLLGASELLFPKNCSGRKPVDILTEQMIRNRNTELLSNVAVTLCRQITTESLTPDEEKRLRDLQIPKKLLQQSETIANTQEDADLAKLVQKNLQAVGYAQTVIRAGGDPENVLRRLEYRY